MKLKKIASLALAGIMAVSMLAGCKDGGNGNSGSSSSEPTAPAGYTATVYAELSKTTKDVLKTKENSVVTDMANAAKAAYKAEFYNGLVALSTKPEEYQVAAGQGTKLSEMSTILNADKNETGSNYVLVSETSANPLSRPSVAADDGKANVAVYAFDADMTENNINKIVADYVTEAMKGVTTNNSGADTNNWYLTADKVTAGVGQNSITFVVVAIEYDLVKA